MQGHTGEVFVLESHPSDSRILLSAGHDGLVILWDMLAGVKLKTLNLEEDGAITCIFDCKFSPDGLTCAAADSSGYLTVMGFGSSEPYKKVFTVHSLFIPVYRTVHVLTVILIAQNSHQLYGALY